MVERVEHEGKSLLKDSDQSEVKEGIINTQISPAQGRRGFIFTSPAYGPEGFYVRCEGTEFLRKKGGTETRNRRRSVG